MPTFLGTPGDLLPTQPPAPTQVPLPANAYVSATPWPDARYAMLTFSTPLTPTEFMRFVRETGVIPIACFVSSSAGGGGMGGLGTTQEMLFYTLQAQEKSVTGATIALDAAAYARVQHAAGVTIDTGTAGFPAGSAFDTVRRWQAAFAAVHTLRGSQHLVQLRDGKPTDLSLSIQSDTDEVYVIEPQHLSRYAVTAHTLLGDVLTQWDGTHASRYWAPWKELYRPQPESENAYWSDEADEYAFLPYLYPKQVSYNLVGPRTLDGRAVIELVIPSGNIMPAGLDNTHVFLDATTYLPYRIVTSEPGFGPNAGKQISLQRTFDPLVINGPVTDADFTFSVPSGAVTIYEQAYMAPRLATYPDLPAAARAADFPLYAPPDVSSNNLYAAYWVEQAGQRSPVIALNNGQILEGRYVPLKNSGRTGMPGEKDHPPQALAVDGQPATFYPAGNALFLTRGATQILIQSVRDVEQAKQLIRNLQPVR